MAEPAPVVVFDFDLTLTRWDTVDRFFRWMLKRDHWRCGIVIAALPVIIPLLLVKHTRKWPIRFAVWVATLGRGLEALPALVEEHVQALPEGHEPVFLPPALEQIRIHLAQGHRVVIATGSLEPLAQAFLNRAGLGEIPLIASTLRPFLGGLVRDQHCFGSGKVPMLSARGFAPPWAAVYTDHHADLPILELAGQCYLVSPKPRCLAIIRRKLPVVPTVLAWR